MNISYNWLKSYLNTDVSVDELSVLLTACGLEVESVEPFESVKGGLKGLVIGEVLETSRHPNADRLTVTKVNTGNEIAQIVCGAPNVAAGQKVIVALPGAVLYPVSGDSFEIKKSKIRGEASEGMICAEDEIGIGTSHDGIMVLPADVVVGAPAASYFNIESDFILSIGLTPNRADAASHIGVARDVKAVLNTRSSSDTVKVQPPSVAEFKTPSVKPVVNVKLNHDAVVRYSGLHLRNVKVKPSPEWLQNRLKAIGLKPINVIVDITNFVLFETGQPLHSFDASRINNSEVIVQSLPKDTKFVTLDSVERKLSGTELMICDANGPMCIAGVFGGLHSGVSNDTTEIFLESACFDSVSVRKTSRFHGLKTDASFRFERGTDPEMTLYALKRAALLIQELAGGECSSEIIDLYPHPVKWAEVQFSAAGFYRLTGVNIPPQRLKQILGNLDIEVLSETDGVMQLRIPPYRVDVTREADVVEEVLRIFGYDNIPMPAKLNASLPPPVTVKLEAFRNTVASYLVANGFTEVMSNSLTRSSVPDGKLPGVVKIKNPLSQELDIMRPEMLSPLLDIARYNKNRRRPDLRIFEYGKTYFKNETAYFETNHLALLVSGSRTPEHWQQKSIPYSVYYLKAIVDNIISVSKTSQSKMIWEPVDNNQLEQAMILKSGKHTVATIGQVKKSFLKSYDVDGVIWYVDLDIDVCNRLAANAFPKISEPPKFPEVRRDLSMLVDKSLQYQSLEALAFETERKLLKEVNLFDFYEGEKIGNDKKSYAMSFILRDDEKTLTDKEIDKVMIRLMENFEKKLGVVIRKG
ncbi:MAG: phenylalanine--tRNA ligase subunit beta [Bacteroidetes bacterium]|nr:phenylalanine--tRNA ligase subunit beta [Bacteroidota bacterium]